MASQLELAFQKKRRQRPRPSLHRLFCPSDVCEERLISAVVEVAVGMVVAVEGFKSARNEAHACKKRDWLRVGRQKFTPGGCRSQSSTYVCKSKHRALRLMPSKPEHFARVEFCVPFRLGRSYVFLRDHGTRSSGSCSCRNLSSLSHDGRVGRKFMVSRLWVLSDC